MFPRTSGGRAWGKGSPNDLFNNNEAEHINAPNRSRVYGADSRASRSTTSLTAWESNLSEYYENFPALNAKYEMEAQKQQANAKNSDAETSEDQLHGKSKMPLQAIPESLGESSAKSSSDPARHSHVLEHSNWKIWNRRRDQGKSVPAMTISDPINPMKYNTNGQWEALGAVPQLPALQPEAAPLSNLDLRSRSSQDPGHGNSEQGFKNKAILQKGKDHTRGSLAGHNIASTLMTSFGQIQNSPGLKRFLGFGGDTHPSQDDSKMRAAIEQSPKLQDFFGSHSGSSHVALKSSPSRRKFDIDVDSYEHAVGEVEKSLQFRGLRDGQHSRQLHGLGVENTGNNENIIGRATQSQPAMTTRASSEPPADLWNRPGPAWLSGSLNPFNKHSNVMEFVQRPTPIEHPLQQLPGVFQFTEPGSRTNLLHTPVEECQHFEEEGKSKRDGILLKRSPVKYNGANYVLSTLHPKQWSDLPSSSVSNTPRPTSSLFNNPPIGLQNASTAFLPMDFDFPLEPIVSQSPSIAGQAKDRIFNPLPTVAQSASIVSQAAESVFNPISTLPRLVINVPDHASDREQNSNDVGITHASFGKKWKGKERAVEDSNTSSRDIDAAAHVAQFQHDDLHGISLRASDDQVHRRLLKKGSSSQNIGAAGPTPPRLKERKSVRDNLNATSPGESYHQVYLRSLQSSSSHMDAAGPTTTRLKEKQSVRDNLNATSPGETDDRVDLHPLKSSSSADMGAAGSKTPRLKERKSVKALNGKTDDQTNESPLKNRLTLYGLISEETSEEQASRTRKRLTKMENQLAKLQIEHQNDLAKLHNEQQAELARLQNDFAKLRNEITKLDSAGDVSDDEPEQQIPDAKAQRQEKPNKPKSRSFFRRGTGKQREGKKDELQIMREDGDLE